MLAEMKLSGGGGRGCLKRPDASMEKALKGAAAQIPGVRVAMAQIAGQNSVPDRGK